MWWARGGTNRLVAGMVRHFERLGGTMRLGDPVVRDRTPIGNRASEVQTESGWRERVRRGRQQCRYRPFLSRPARRHRARRRRWAGQLAKKRFSPSLFVVHFGIEGTWPGIPHHMILFGPRYKGLLDDIYERGVLPAGFLDLPAPPDRDRSEHGAARARARSTRSSRWRIMGKLSVDWDEVGPQLEKRILDEVGRRLIPDIHDRIVTKFHYAPKRFRPRPQRPSRQRLQPGTDADPERLVPRPQPRRRDRRISTLSAQARIPGRAFPAWSAAPRRRPG